MGANDSELDARTRPRAGEGMVDGRDITTSYSTLISGS